METDKLYSKDDLLHIKLIEFYKKTSNLNIFLNIILQDNQLSLRVIDWFVTNYSKKYNISYLIKKDGEEFMYFPYKGYKAQLKAYSKKFCDPFCRRERIKFDYRNFKILDLHQNVDHAEYIITTVGQLNFFRFSIVDKIIEYTTNNISLIEEDMINTLKNRDLEKKFIDVKSIKRKELSTLGNKSIHISEIRAIIKFK